MKIFKNWSDAVFYYMIAIIEAVLSTYFAFVLSRLVDLASNGTIDAVLKFLMFVFVYLVISILVTYFFKAYNNKLVYKYMLSYKNAVYGSSLTDRHSEGVNAGEYINVLTNDAVQLETIYVQSCLDVPQQLFCFLTGTVAAVIIHPLLFVLIFLFGCISAFLMKARSKAMIKTTEALSQKNEIYAKDLKAQLEANLLLRMEGLTNWSQILISESADKALSAHLDQKQAVNKTRLAVMSLGLVSTLVVMGAATIFAIYGYVSAGAVIASGHLIGRITSPIGELGRLYTNYKAGKELKNKIKKQFNIYGTENNRTFSSSENKINNPDTERSRESAGIKPSARINIERISLSALDFSVSGKNILKNIDFDFEGGKKYAVVGKAGSGKSTLLKLIAGILDSDSQIKYNGKILSSPEIFNSICYIPQNITILEDTLEKNILLNKKDISSNGIYKNIIEKVGLSDLAEKRKANSNKIDASVSGGEKQKIAMARALVKDASVFLLDEFNSGLDNYSIKLIEDIVTEQKGKLVIFITHRLNPETLKKCDEILFMQDGKIAEHGNFSVLLENDNSLFKNFYENDAEKINNPDAERSR